jgi:hypothetical protein
MFMVDSNGVKQLQSRLRASGYDLRDMQEAPDGRTRPEPRHSPSDRPGVAEIAAHVAEMAQDLSAMARYHGLKDLTYFLDMARHQAQQDAKLLTRPVPVRKAS